MHAQYILKKDMNARYVKHDTNLCNIKRNNKQKNLFKQEVSKCKHCSSGGNEEKNSVCTYSFLLISIHRKKMVHKCFIFIKIMTLNDFFQSHVVM